MSFDKLFNSLVSPKGQVSYRAAVTLALFLIWDRQGRMDTRLAVIEMRLGPYTAQMTNAPAAVQLGPDWPKHLADAFQPTSARR